MNNLSKQRRKQRTSLKIYRSSSCPIFKVFRSNKHIYAQILDHKKNQTLISFSDLNLSKEKNSTVKTNKQTKAYEIGQLIAKKAKEKNIARVVFDRGMYKYHGRILSVAKGARDAGLKF